MITVSVVKPTLLYGTRKYDDRCSKETSVFLLYSKKRSPLHGNKKKLMTISVVKPTLLYGTQKIDDWCSGKSSMVTWYSKIDGGFIAKTNVVVWFKKSKTVAVMKPVRLYVWCSKTDDLSSKRKERGRTLLTKLMMAVLRKPMWLHCTQKSMTIAVVKPTLLCGTPKIDNWCNEKTSVVEWYGKIRYLLQW